MIVGKLNQVLVLSGKSMIIRFERKKKKKKKKKVVKKRFTEELSQIDLFTQSFSEKYLKYIYILPINLFIFIETAFFLICTFLKRETRLNGLPLLQCTST